MEASAPGSDHKLSGEQNPSGANSAELKPPTDGGKPKMTEDAHDAPFFQCGFCDKQITYKISQELLSGLATACVDSTTGGLFKTPAMVAVEIRKEMVDYLRTRSEYFVAESIVMEGGSETEVSEHPFDIISNFVDDFALSKRNFFSRVSSWALSDMREDKIDDFVQQMETNSFWVLDRRETVTQVLLRNVDFKNHYHCKMRLASKEELEEHQESCDFRPVMCDNEGCSDTFSAKQIEKHDAHCPFKLLHCEQGCPEYLLRREMDRHCITVCPMKLASCTFFSVGCQYQVPQCKIKQHCSESRHSHLVNVLQFIHKDASEDDAQLWAEKIENSEFSDQLEARDVRSFTRAVKDIESRIGPFKDQRRNKKDVKDAKAHQPSEQASTDSPQPKLIGRDPSPEQAANDPSPEQTSKDPPTLQASEDILLSKKASENPSLLERVIPDTSTEAQGSSDPPSFEQALKEPPSFEQALKDPPSFEQALKDPPQLELTSADPLSPAPEQASEDVHLTEPPSNSLTAEKPTTNSPQSEQSSEDSHQPKPPSSNSLTPEKPSTDSPQSELVSEDPHQPKPPSSNSLTSEKPLTDSPQSEQAAVNFRQPEHVLEKLTPEEHE